MQDRGGTPLRFISAGHRQGLFEGGLRMRRTQAQGRGAEHELGSVAVGEQRVADAASRHEHIDTGPRDRRGDAIGELGEELLLAGEVPVEGAGLYLETPGDPAHREVGQSHLVEQRESGPGNAVAVMPGRVVLWAHGLSIVNTVHVNTVQEEEAMTPHRSDPGRDLARIAVFAALIVILGTVTIPIPGGVPITAQTLGVMLAGAVLGPRLAPLAVLLVLGLAAVGMPVLAGGRGGLGVFAGPTAGYLAGWVVGAVVIGLIVRGGRITWWRTAIAAVLGGILVVYLFGIPIQALVLGLDLAPTALSSLAFLPGDLVKATVATLLVVALRRAYPQAFGQSAVPIPAPRAA